MKTIAFIGQKGFPAEFSGTSGIEFYVENKVMALTDVNNVIVYTRSWAGSRKIGTRGVQVISLPTINTKHLDAFVHSLFATLHACFFTNSQIIWYQGIGPGFFSFIPKLLGKQVMLTIHSLDWQRDKWGRGASGFLLFSERVAIASTDTIYCVAKHLQSYITTIYGKSTKLDQIYVKRKANVEQKTVMRVLNKYKLQPTKYILYLGRIVPEKRIEWLIDAFVQTKTSGTKLVIAGGQSHSQDYENILRKIVNNTNIIFTGYIFGEEKQIILANTKLFVLPSKLEGYPIAITEALRYKRRCLVSSRLQEEYPISAQIIYFQADSYIDFRRQLRDALAMPSYN